MAYRRDWTSITYRAAQIVNEHDGLLTVRGLFYRLLSEEWIRAGDYNYLSKTTAQARRDGWFPDLLDRTRRITQPPHWTGPGAAQKALIRQYRRDRTEGQQFNVYVAVEKEAMLGALERWYGHRGYPLIALKGYSSQTLADIVRRNAEADERPAVLVYAGDLDPSGVDIDRSFRERTDCFASVIRVALRFEQIKQYGLVKLPGKREDTRAARFIQRYGSLFQVEIDGLVPADLKALYDKELDKMWDEDAYQRCLAREAQDRKRLQPLNPWIP